MKSDILILAAAPPEEDRQLAEVCDALRSRHSLRLAIEGTDPAPAPTAGTAALLFAGPVYPKVMESLGQAAPPAIYLAPEDGRIPDGEGALVHLRRADLVLLPSREALARGSEILGEPMGHRALRHPARPDGRLLRLARQEEARRDARRSFQLAHDRPLILLEADEHPAELEAARFAAWQLAEHVPMADLLLVGNAGRHLVDHPLPLNVHRTGWLPREGRVRALLAASAVLIPHRATQGWRVPAERVVECLAAGRPVFATGDALPRSLRNGPGGIRLLRRDAMAGELREFLTGGAPAHALVEDARETGRRLLSPGARYEGLLRFIHHRGRRRLIAVNDYEIVPARQGGQVRLEAICRCLAAAGIPVTLVTLGEEAEGKLKLAGGNFDEVVIPRGRALAGRDRWLSRLAGANAADVSTLLFARRHCRGVEGFLRRELPRAGAALFSHPYMNGFLDLAPKETPVYFDSQNTEWLLKQAIYPRWMGRWGLSRLVRRAEVRLVRRSRGILCVSGENRADLRKMAGELPAAAMVCGNGVHVEGRPCPPLSERPALRRQAGLGEEPMAVFLGSGHPPNAEAARLIIETMAEALPGVRFVLIGSVAGWFHGAGVPPNVHLLGMVGGGVKDFLLSVADVALNPMLTGSGSSVKMMDYMAAGLPILSTGVGARGMSLPERESTIILEPEGFAEGLRALLADTARRAELSCQSRRIAMELCDWKVTLGPMVEEITRQWNTAAAAGGPEGATPTTPEIHPSHHGRS